MLTFGKDKGGTNACGLRERSKVEIDKGLRNGYFFKSSGNPIPEMYPGLLLAPGFDNITSAQAP
jgi:hypothetical protein